ncbi:shikimate dehydrogenase family protein [Sphingomonas sp. LHG3443-2]|uniref:shikimate dehydrogenase family protein n=1 Tax=Sphingomonas sp. LHG3443-2 TaxID=2804639 RepID=UPI003CF5BB83
MTSRTPYAEVIGDPIGHSKSPLIHRFWLQKLGIKGDYRATRVSADELAPYFDSRCKDPLWRGCNLTMPLKEAAVPFAAQRSADVDKIAASNCLTRGEGNLLHAWNFDVQGVAVPLARETKATYSNHVATYVQIIGAGGAASAAALGAVRAGFSDIDVFARDPVKARAFAELLGTPHGQAQPLEALGPIRNPTDGADEQRYSQVIINATPLGMRGRPEVPVDLSAYYPDTIVFDMVYDPLETGLLRQARHLGMRTIDGLEMLIEQASHGFRRFFGADAPRQHDAELRRLLSA